MPFYLEMLLLARVSDPPCVDTRERLRSPRVTGQFIGGRR